MALAKAGASRQEGHEWIREESLQAWDALQRGEANPLVQLLTEDERVTAYLSPTLIQELMEAGEHVGTAVSRALAFAETIRQSVNN
jgi:adenylosuccinate lyase